jgi:hypothetical protein
VVAVIGLVVCIVTRRQVLLPVLLLAATLAPAIYHLYIHESVSLDKHLDFGLVFAAPLIGLAASVTRQTWQRLAVGLGAAWLVLSGLASSKFIYGEWANTKPLVDVMAYAFDSAPYIRNAAICRVWRRRRRVARPLLAVRLLRRELHRYQCADRAPDERVRLPAHG